MIPKGFCTWFGPFEGIFGHFWSFLGILWRPDRGEMTWQRGIIRRGMCVANWATAAGGCFPAEPRSGGAGLTTRRRRCAPPVSRLRRAVVRERPSLRGCDRITRRGVSRLWTYHPPVYVHMFYVGLCLYVHMYCVGLCGCICTCILCVYVHIFCVYVHVFCVLYMCSV